MPLGLSKSFLRRVCLCRYEWGFGGSTCLFFSRKFSWLSEMWFGTRFVTSFSKCCLEMPYVKGSWTESDCSILEVITCCNSACRLEDTNLCWMLFRGLKNTELELWFIDFRYKSADSLREPGEPQREARTEAVSLSRGSCSLECNRGLLRVKLVKSRVASPAG